MTFHRLALAAAAIFALGCADAAPTAPDLADESAQKINKNRPAAPLVLPATGALADGGSFTGTVTIQRFDLASDGTLRVTGLVAGTATTADGLTHAIAGQAFTTSLEMGRHAGAQLSLSGTGAEAQLQQNGGCGILFLDIGPIFLDLLGLQLDLSRIVLDLTAQPGAGNLLGNLLCAVVNLLNGPALFSAIINLLDQINTLLGALGG